MILSNFACFWSKFDSSWSPGSNQLRGTSWNFVELRGTSLFQWFFIDFHWFSLIFHRFSMIFIDFHRFSLLLIDFHRFSFIFHWFFIAFHTFSLIFQWFSLIFIDFHWFFIDFHRFFIDFYILGSSWGALGGSWGGFLGALGLQGARIDFFNVFYNFVRSKYRFFTAKKKKKTQSEWGHVHEPLWKPRF